MRKYFCKLTALFLSFCILVLPMANVYAENDVTGFTDISPDRYFYNSVLWGVENNITVGTSKTTFSPDAKCTRAQIVTFLWRYSGCPESNIDLPFTDVNEDRYFYQAVQWAYENEITVGTSKTEFSPDAPCTRAQAVTLIWRFAGEELLDVNLSSFSDIPADSYYAASVLWALAYNITTGTSKLKFSPQNTCTRAQIITFLYRFDQVLGLDTLIPDTDGDGLNDQDEELAGTDINNPDTDNDGVSDFDEIFHTYTDPTIWNDFSGDTDGDGLTDNEEPTYGTDIYSPDTDGDGLTDYEEVCVYFTNPLSPDTDGDGLDDGFENDNDLDPVDESTDGENNDDEVLIDQVIGEAGIAVELRPGTSKMPPSLSGEAAGEMAKHVFLGNSDESIFTDNKSIVSELVEVNGDDSYLSGLTLSFDTSAFGTDVNMLSICELDDDGLFHAVETETGENQIYTELEGSGTFFVVDFNALMDSLDVAAEEKVTLESLTRDIPAVQSMESHPADNNTVTDEVYGELSIYTEEIPEETAVYEQNDASEEGTIKGQADIVFAIDTTGSMSGAISNVINNVTTFAQRLDSEYDVRVNYGLIDFKDIEADGADSTKVLTSGASNWFTNSSSFTEKCKQLHATGGGDTPESDIDALETARRLDFRTTAEKFIILITDANYKTANNYGITSMEEEIELLKKDGITVCVVTSGSYQSTYQSLYESTNGIYANIYSDFSSALISIADLIGEKTANGEWVILKHGLSFVKLENYDGLDTSKDTDGDGLKDYEELGEKTVINLFPRIQEALKRLGISEELLRDKLTITVYDARSNPMKADTEGDGINDKEDSAPWRKGDSNGVIGSLKLIVNMGPPLYEIIGNEFTSNRGATGHAFLLYQSNVNDSLDFSGYNFGYATSTGYWKDASRESTCTSAFKMSPSSAAVMSAGGDEVSTNCATYNYEFYKHYNPGWSYQPNAYLERDMTQTDLDQLISYFNGQHDVSYDAITHSCVHVCTGAWEKLWSQKINPFGVNTPRNVYYDLLNNFDASEDFSLDTVISG